MCVCLAFPTFAALKLVGAVVWAIVPMSTHHKKSQNERIQMTTSDETTPQADTPTTESPNSLLGVLRIIFRWKREIVKVCLAAGIGTAVISLFLSNYYQASTTFLAISPDQAKPELIFGDGTFEPEIYGNQDDIDRLLTIAESNELIDFLVDSFNLYEHYDINPDKKKAPFLVRRAFLALYEVTKTKRDAIELTIEDKDPVLAARMAQAAHEKIDQIAQRLIKANQFRTIETFERDIEGKLNQLTSINDTMVRLRQFYGVFNPVSQSELLTATFAQAESNVLSTQAQIDVYREIGGRFRDSIPKLEARLKGHEQEVGVIQKQLERLNIGMSSFLTLERQNQEANRSLSMHQEKLKQYRAAYESDIPATLLVEKATEPLVKSRPRRSIIVLVAGALAFLFSIIGVLLIESYRDINWRDIYHGS